MEESFEDFGAFVVELVELGAEARIHKASVNELEGAQEAFCRAIAESRLGRALVFAGLVKVDFGHCDGSRRVLSEGLGREAGEIDQIALVNKRSCKSGEDRREQGSMGKGNKLSGRWLLANGVGHGHRVEGKINMPQTVGSIAVADECDSGVVVNAQTMGVKGDGVAGVTDCTDRE
jgi:hypothetical protein